MAFECSFNESLVEYACSQIWLGKEPLKWVEKLKEVKQIFTPVGDLAWKTWLCLFLFQLHIHLKRVQNGSKVFYNQKKFLEAFRTIKRLFPFSKVEMECMGKKLQTWTLKTDATVKDCEAMIKEVKQFLQPVYEKFTNSQSEEAFKAYQKKLDRSTKPPSASTLKDVFFWMFDGNTDQAKEEWEGITQGKHPDVIQLRRKLAKRKTASGTVGNKTHRNDSSGINLMNTLPGCSGNVQDTKKQTVGKKFDFVNSKKGKQPVYTNLRKQRLVMLEREACNNYSSDDSDQDEIYMNHKRTENIESSDGIVDPSQDEEDGVEASAGKRRNKLNLPFFKVAHSESEEPEICYSQKRDTWKRVRRPNNQILLGETDDEPDELVITHSQKRGNSKKTENQRPVCTSEQKKTDKLVMATRTTACDLSEATHNLMKIVKDPYEKLMEGSDDKVKDVTPKNRKTSRWMDPQENAAVLIWSSSDEVSDEDPKKIELPSRHKPNKHLIDLTTNNAGKRPSPRKPERKRRRLWTLEEMDWIREGVKIYGRGNWATILVNYPFVNRSSVDIKDKYRNMLRNAEI